MFADSSLRDQFSREPEDIIQHLLSQPASEGVLLAGVIGPNEGDTACQIRGIAMPEFWCWYRVFHSQFLPGPYISAETHLPQANHDSQVLQALQLVE